MNQVFIKSDLTRFMLCCVMSVAVNHADAAILNIKYQQLALLENPATVEKLEPQPLIGKPYRLADQAYRALEKGNIAEAEKLVNKALRIRPDSKQLGELALDIQTRKGDLAGAKLRADDLLNHFPGDAQILASRGYLLQRLNQHDAAVADFSQALSRSTLTEQQQHDVRLTLADSAILTKHPLVALDALIPVLNPASYAVQIRVAQARQMMGGNVAARAAAESASKLAGNAAERDFAQRFIANIANLTIASKPEALPKSLTPMVVSGSLLDKAYGLLGKAKDREALLAFQQAFNAGGGSSNAYADAGYTAQRLGEHQLAGEYFKASLIQQPALDASHEQEIRLAMADAALGNKHPQEVLDALKPLAKIESYAVHIRLAAAEMLLSKKDSAITETELANRYATTENEFAFSGQQLAVLRSSLGVADQDMTDVDLRKAYDLLAAHQDQESLTAFQRGFATGKGSAINYADAGYAAKRLGKNAKATELMGRALTLNDASPEGSKPFTADQVFGYDREMQEMSRTWGFMVNVSKQHAPPVGGRTRTNNIAGGADLYWQPYFSNGRLAQLYVSTYENMFDYTGTNAAGVPRVATGLKSNLSAVGVRYKPFGDNGVMLSAERQVSAPTGYTNEALLRIGYSTDNGTDIKPVAHDWSTFQFYAAATFYLASNNRYIYNAEGTYGHSFHLSTVSDRLVAYPHFGINGYFDSNQSANTVPNLLLGPIVPVATRESWSYGPGVKFRYWLPERGRFSSASVVDLTLQYHMRRGPGPNVQIGQGLLANLSFWY